MDVDEFAAEQKIKPLADAYFERKRFRLRDFICSDGQFYSVHDLIGQATHILGRVRPDAADHEGVCKLFQDYADFYEMNPAPLKDFSGIPRKKKDNFYATRSWLALRVDVLRERKRECVYCGATEGAFHVDHIKPRSKFPDLELDPENMQILCRDCNIGKAARVFET